MACFYNQHQKTVNGIPLTMAQLAAMPGSPACDCGEMFADTGEGVLHWDYSPTGQLMGR